MIPRTYPSVVNSTLDSEMVISFLSSVTGLVAWTDYIPVKLQTATPGAFGTTEVDGYAMFYTIPSTTGKAAWVDYIPVYEYSAGTKQWSTDALGYIPYGTGGRILFSIAQLYTASQQGAWYEPSTMSTLFQDSTGVTAVTGVEATNGTVGLMLDKRLGAPTLGAQEIVNGTFDSGVTGWTANAGTSISLDTQRLKLTSSDGTQYASIFANFSSPGSLIVGQLYVATFDIIAGTYAGAYGVAFEAAASSYTSVPSNGASGPAVVKFYADHVGTNDSRCLRIRFDSVPTTGQYFYIDNVTFKRLPGNHALQATSAARPVLSSRVNLLTYSEEFDNAAWTKANATVTANTHVAPDGTTTADTYASAGAIGYLYPTLAHANPFTNSIYVKLISGTPSTVFRIRNYPSATDVAIPITTEWTRVSYYCAAGTGSNAFVISIEANSSVAIWGAQLEVGPTATTYQRIAAATDYNTTGFPSYLKYDGSDDSLATTTGGGTTAGFFLCQAVKPLGGAGAVRRIFADSGTNAGYRVQLDANNKLSFSAGNGTAYTTIVSVASVDLGTTVVITAWDDGTDLKVQINQGAVASVARPSVTAGTAGFTLGKDNGAASGFFTGNLYPSVFRTTSPTAAEIASTQQYVALQAGVTL